MNLFTGAKGKLILQDLQPLQPLFWRGYNRHRAGLVDFFMCRGISCSWPGCTDRPLAFFRPGRPMRLRRNSFGRLGHASKALVAINEHLCVLLNTRFRFRKDILCWHFNKTVLTEVNEVNYVISVRTAYNSYPAAAGAIVSQFGSGKSTVFD